MSDKPTTRRNYTPAEITEGILAVIHLGSHRAAAETLGIPRQTIDYWIKHHQDQYRELHDKHKTQIEDDAARRMRDKLLLADQVETAAIELEHQRILNGEVKDAAASARNMATVKGINADKLLTMTGRPAQITEHRNTDEILAKLKQYGLTVDSSAEEIQDADQLTA